MTVFIFAGTSLGRESRQSAADVALERGFASVDDFLKAAGPFYLCDKACATGGTASQPMVIHGAYR